ncbi:MAG TPA: SH3 domain-containing protein [Stellaceae bacterium]|nr:SH3 domain-containing protein [Stellaceae bacterium]
MFRAASLSSRSQFAFVALAVLLFAAVPARADDKPGVPRFASLRVGEVNLRSGPGTKYPIQFVYHHKGLPVEILSEYDIWLKVRDWQGSEGWVHERMITPARTVIIKTDTRTIYRDPARDSPALAKLEPGVVARLLECRNAWCRIETEKQNIKGWLLRTEVWGVYPDEVVQ